MSKIKILVDSTSDLPLEWEKELDIGIIPLHVLWGGKAQDEDDNRDLESIVDFWKRLGLVEALPKTSQPTPLEFKAKIDKYFEQGYTGVFILTLSDKMSGTYNSAEIAAKNYFENVMVMDTLKASSAIAVMARRARELFEEGKTLNEVHETLVEDRKNNRFGAYFYVTNFDFLRKGGRVSHFQSFVGSMLKLRVGMTIDDKGQMVPFNKSMGSSKVQNAILEEMGHDFPFGCKVNLAMVYADSLQECQELYDKLAKKYQVNQVVYTPMGKVISTHVGPGTAGFGIERIE